MQITVNEQIRLTEIRPGDKPAYLRHLNESDVFQRHLLVMPYPYTEADADEWIAQATAPSGDPPSEYRWAIRNKTEDLIGGAGLHAIVAGHKAEIGYWLAQPYWGRGIMTDTVRAVCRFAFQELGLVRVYAYVFSANRASARVLEKAGFEQEGLLRKHYRKRDAFVDDCLYALVR